MIINRFNLGKSEKGITLLALIVTIIVLLILAGVSIAILVGENRNNEQCGKIKEGNGYSNYKRTY